MAQTYTVSDYQQLGNLKSMMSIFNGSGSGKIIRIYKVWAINHAHVAAAGTVTKIILYKTSNCISGSDISSKVVKHQTTNESIPVKILVKSGATDTTSESIRQVVYISGTSATAIGATYTVNQWESIYALMRIFECGYYNSNLEPIVLRENEGICLKCTGTTTAGFLETVIEFTMSDT